LSPSVKEDKSNPFSSHLLDDDDDDALFLVTHSLLLSHIAVDVDADADVDANDVDISTAKDDRGEHR